MRVGARFNSSLNRGLPWRYSSVKYSLNKKSSFTVVIRHVSCTNARCTNATTVHLLVDPGQMRCYRCTWWCDEPLDRLAVEPISPSTGIPRRTEYRLPARLKKRVTPTFATASASACASLGNSPMTTSGTAASDNVQHTSRNLERI